MGWADVETRTKNQAEICCTLWKTVAKDVVGSLDLYRNWHYFLGHSLFKSTKFFPIWTRW
jgi:hypothetical protein